MVSRVVAGLLGMLVAMASTQAGAQAANVQSVVYVEVALSVRQQALKAFADYAAEIKQQDAFESIELFEQRERPGHYVLIETWRNQAALEARAVEQVMLATWLEKLRISNVDRRPYKTLDIAPAKTAAEGAVYVISHVDAAPNEAVPGILQQWVTASRAEPGNVRFDMMQHQQRGNHYTVIEIWRDEAALQEHVEAAHTRRFRDQFGPFAGSPLDERLFDAVPL